ncbi:MAG: YIP1 family protein [Bacteroidota bacterium]|nr:YIP1 family protein [Bacteroidota bacterium]MDP4193940.1 YIP1 family protein [Bacteroidota bacterium]
MKNVITCKNCKAENPYFSYICNNCRSYLRERVVNIDLWKTLGTIIESPTKAFSNIIHAEHKNFISLLYFLFAIKFFINILMIDDPVFGSIKVLNNVSLLFLLSLIVPIVVICVFALLLKFVTKLLKVQTRFKDNLSILIYSLVPSSIALVFFFPVELVLFGSALFISNPSPFLLKQNPAYVMSALEGLMVIWSFVLTFFAIKSATKSVIFSLISSILFHGIMIGLLLVLTKIFS